MTAEAGPTDVQYGGITLIASPERGRYPSANSLLVSGTDVCVLVDPSMEVHRRGGLPRAVDLVVVSHAHEDHLAGLHLFPDVPAVAHPAEVAAVGDPDVLVAGFGMDAPEASTFRAQLHDSFHVTGHGHVRSFDDGDVIDLGGRTITVVHLPGHTAGHCGLLVEPDGFLFTADIDLTSFGPYYGDLSSSLEQFEASLRRLRDIEARWYGTSHQVGVLEGQRPFRERLDRFAGVIQRREETLLRLLAQPRTLDDVVAHRLVYRPHVPLPFVQAVERRTALQHLDRLQRNGLVTSSGGEYLAL